MKKEIYKDWRLEIDSKNIAWLYFDKSDSSTNVLSVAVFNELDTILEDLKNRNPDGLIIVSAKDNGFIAGADVHSFTNINTELGHSVLNKLEALSFPTLSLINGFCLGGGLELALACRYRIALDDPNTRIGLPEVRLGFHPGWGGTLRLVRLIGVTNAMNLMLSGRTVNARDAKKLGIVDRAVPVRHFNNAAVMLLSRLPPKHKPVVLQSIASHRLFRPIIAKYLSKAVGKRASRNHYPAPYALINLWEKHGGHEKEMLQAEIISVAELITTPTVQNLVRVFLLLGRDSDFKPQHVHVIGAGVMGGDIAAWCAFRGLTVTLQDREPKFIAPVLKRAYILFKKRLKEPHRIQAAMDRLIPDHKGLGISRADVVIEAIIENLEAKQSLYKQIEPELKKNAVLATNTSSIPLDNLSLQLKEPGRLVGIHFFNPVALMQLVEIVQGNNTDKQTLDQAAAFCRYIDRLPLPVTSSPGFLVNRILMPYLMEAVTLLQEGIPARVIDKAAIIFGMPMGPIELADSVGLDICLSVAEILAKSLDLKVPEELRSKVEQGQLGRKSGRGFYYYKNGKPCYKKEKIDNYSLDEITDRLILPMINESIACLREGVVQDPDLVDAGMILGSGFAPFRGGPMHYMEECGRKTIKGRLQALKEKYGERFAPDTGWA
jgi:3-hydroxyacyl-CoA dehydrogenase / enoyl-CoA hydratase / 3-hydroxybutyryl-CoA epimerase